MTLWEYLDARHARHVGRPPADPKLVMGALFLTAFFGLIIVLVFTTVPDSNKDMVRDSLLILGPGVGAIIQAMFRTDRRDEQAAVNTGEAFKAVRAAAESRTNG